MTRSVPSLVLAVALLAGCSSDDLSRSFFACQSDRDCSGEERCRPCAGGPVCALPSEDLTLFCAAADVPGGGGDADATAADEGPGDAPADAPGAPPPRIHYGRDAYRLRLGAPAAIPAPTVTPPPAGAVTFTGTLPAGLTLDPATGAIAGTPSATWSGPLLQITAAPSGAAVALDLAVLDGWAVTTTADSDDATPGDGLCADAGGACSLSAAVQESEALPGHQIATLADATYFLQSEMHVAGTLVLAGPPGGAATLDAGGGSRHFTVDGGELELHDLVLTGGRSGLAPGGAVVVTGGGILGAHFTRFLDNATDTDAFAGGGAVLVEGGGAARLRDCELADNASAWNGGAIDNNSGSVDVARTLMRGNSALYGSALHHASAQGGVRLENVTLFGNHASGGGVFGHNSTRTVELLHCTIVANDGAERTGGLMLWSEHARYEVTGSIVAGNTLGGAASDCHTENPGGAIALAGINVLDPARCAATLEGADGAVAGELPGAALSDAGGFTQVVAPPAGHAAVDAAPAASCPALDQRRAPRDPARCDLGAYEGD